MKKKAANLPRTFEEFIEEQGFELRPWQKEAANALLEVMYPHRVGATGKTFLTKQLWNFVMEYGSFYETEQELCRRQRINELIARNEPTLTKAHDIAYFTWHENLFFLVLNDDTQKTEQPCNGAAYLEYLRRNNVREFRS